MYVKLFNKILDSSIAEDRKLRHFFTDLLLCADADGNVVMTNEAISRRTKAPIEEIEWGLKELSSPDPTGGFTLEHDGRRIVPLEGHGYGWKIINFELYRDIKSAEQLRRSTAERVKRYRERKKLKRRTPQPGEGLVRAGADTGETADRVNEERGFGGDL